MTLLLSPRLKLERAGEHLKALHAELVAYTERQPHHFTSQVDSEGWTVVSLEIVRPMPEVIPVIAGDAIHCLRSALDHIVYAVSTGSKRRRGYWPICIKEADYLLPRGAPPCERPSMREEGLGGVPESILTIIDGAQPYHGRDRANEHVLAVIGRLDNADKHRVVQTALGVLKNPGTVQSAHPGDEEATLITEIGRASCRERV